MPVHTPNGQAPPRSPREQLEEDVALLDELAKHPGYEVLRSYLGGELEHLSDRVLYDRLTPSDYDHFTGRIQGLRTALQLRDALKARLKQSA